MQKKNNRHPKNIPDLVTDATGLNMVDTVMVPSFMLST